ncbi:MAG TPA: YlzJ-like family protein [Pseudogracilibacillus sp.]|nr:YlzJ-like family protein [Pseudogracilibacillus sp.]
MVLYTPLSTDEIFPGEEEGMELVSYQGKSVFVKKTEQGELQLVQLLSTDPQDFLNSNFAPGSILPTDRVQPLRK